MGRWWAAAAAVALFALALASPAGAAGVLTAARGPHVVHPGRVVSFEADGMLARKRIAVTVQPSKCVGSNGCAVRAGGSWRSDSRGHVRARFRFPYRYFFGCAGSECAEHPLFLRGQHAQVQLCITAPLRVDEEGRGHLCALRSVRIAAPAPPARARERGVERLGLVSGCRPFVVLRGSDDYVGSFTLRAWSVRRATRLRCRMARRLIKAAYDTGPLQVIRTTHPDGSPGHPDGRATYWLRGGWRCSNGAGGAACFNARRPIFNTIETGGPGHGLAVLASTGLR